jgi:hypothetical protein
MQEIRDIRAQCAGPWLIGGDFNLIYKDKDKNNSNLNRAMMGRFCWLINDLSIKEVPLVGRRFTWSSSVSGSSPMLVKLDWVFCSMDWEDIFPNCLLQSAANEDSDYCPLILGLVDGYPRKKRFRFECFWPKFQGFHEVVQTAWASVPPTRCPLETLSLSLKIKATMKGLQSWSDRKVGNFIWQLDLAREIVHQLEIARDGRQLSPLEIMLHNNLKKLSLALSSLLRTVARI